MKYKYGYFMIMILGLSCQPTREDNTSNVRLITLNPGHFHAALVQKSLYENVDTNVFVYAPTGQEVQQYLDKIKSYNSRSEEPTRWNEQAYLGDDFLDKMMAEKKGNVVVIAGNNKNKTQYINRSIDGGFNVLADKPMVIDQQGFELLKKSFTKASEKKLVLYDIMTERYEMTNILQREFAMQPGVFGVLQKGTPEMPAVEMESVHCFYKYVSGSVLTRPSWFMDVSQQGEAITDVATHLVDLVQWECFPDSIIDYKNDIEIETSSRWSTNISLSQFKAITKTDGFPDYFENNIIKDTILPVFANGEINYRLKGVYIKVVAKWDFKAKEGSGDTHYSVLYGTKANLIIRQGAEESCKPILYIEPTNGGLFVNELNSSVKAIQNKYPNVEVRKVPTGWAVVIPEKYREGHEAHFAMVTKKFLKFLKEGNMPVWEVPNMLAKYYTTTHALEVAKKDSKPAKSSIE